MMDAITPFPFTPKMRTSFLTAVVMVIASVPGILCGDTAPSPVAGPDPVRQPARYHLSPFDTVKISVYGQPDLETSQRLTDSGLVAMPLLGNIEIGGLTVQDAQEKIRRAFIEDELLRDPVVSLAIEEFSPKQVTVLGQVNRPGAVPLPNGSNSIAIESAVAMAGGFTGTARRNRVRVTRYDSDAGRERVFRVDLDEILEDSDGDFSATTFRVNPEDIVFVPQRLF